MFLPCRRIVVTLRECVGVESDVSRVINELLSRCGAAVVDQEAIVDLPEGRAALFDGADHRISHTLRRSAGVGDVDELEAGDAGPDVLVDQSRLNLSRDAAAFWSKRIAVFDDQHRRVGVADEVALDDQSVAMAAADCLDV